MSLNDETYINSHAMSADLQLDSKLRDLRSFDLKIDESCTGQVLLNIFQDHQPTPGVIFLNQNQLSGLLSSHKFFEILSLPHNQEQFLQQPLHILSQAYPFIRENMTILAGDTPISEAVRICLNRVPETLYEPLIVELSEQTYQVISFQDLLVAQAQICQLAMFTIEQQNAEIRDQNRQMREYLEDLEIVTNAAIAIENDAFQDQQLTPVVERSDALGRLARVFQHMFHTVKVREQELEAINEHLEAILNAVPGSIAWIDSQGFYIGVNRFLAENWNMDQEAFIGKEVGFLEGNKELTHFMRDFIASPQESAAKVIKVEFQDTQRYYLIVTQKYQQGTATVSVGIDITDRKQAEEALQIAEENYRSIFENALEGIFQSSPEGHFIRINPALAKIYGYDSPQDMLACITDIGEQLWVNPEQRLEFKEKLEQEGTIKDFEYRSYHKDGTIIWTQIEARLVRDKYGDILFYEGIVQDITERKLREEALRQQLEELQINIDQQKRAREVETITSTNYFQEVQQAIENVSLDEFWT
jgi:PAS domain S-box-containing protein